MSVKAGRCKINLYLYLYLYLYCDFPLILLCRNIISIFCSVSNQILVESNQSQKLNNLIVSKTIKQMKLLYSITFLTRICFQFSPKSCNIVKIFPFSTEAENGAG